MTNTQFSVNKTPFFIADILTDLKVNGGGGGDNHHSPSDESDSVMLFHNHHHHQQESTSAKQMLYGITSSRRDNEGLAYSEVAREMRKRMDDKRGSGSLVRRGSLECFLIDNNNTAQSQSYAPRRDSYFADQAAQKPLDMRRSVGSLSDHYDSGEELI